MWKMIEIWNNKPAEALDKVSQEIVDDHLRYDDYPTLVELPNLLIFGTPLDTLSLVIFVKEN